MSPGLGVVIGAAAVAAPSVLGVRCAWTGATMGRMEFAGALMPKHDLDLVTVFETPRFVRLGSRQIVSRRRLDRIRGGLRRFRYLALNLQR